MSTFFLCKIWHNTVGGWFIAHEGRSISAKDEYFGALRPFTNSPCCIVNIWGPNGLVWNSDRLKNKEIHLVVTNQLDIFTRGRGLWGSGLELGLKCWIGLWSRSGEGYVCQRHAILWRLILFMVRVMIYGISDPRERKTNERYFCSFFFLYF